MSWGIRIAALYVGFVLLIAALIVRSSMENTDLETADYYEQELKYQEQIDGSEALLNAGVQPVIAMNDSVISVVLPAELSEQASGTVNFYRPDNAELDMNYSFKDPAFTVPLNKFKRGAYRVRVDWTNKGQHYFYESGLYIP